MEAGQFEAGLGFLPVASRPLLLSGAHFDLRFPKSSPGSQFFGDQSSPVTSPRVSPTERDDA